MFYRACSYSLILLCFIAVSVVAGESDPLRDPGLDPKLNDLKPHPDPQPVDPHEVDGSWVLVDEAIVQTWTEQNNPFDEDDDWSDVPGDQEDIGVLMTLNIPFQDGEDGPFVRYTIRIAAGEIDGQPKCWLYDDGGLPGGRGPGIWWPVCCYAQGEICRLINDILGWIGDIICPQSHCSDCEEECLDIPSQRDNPCHSCGFCGGMWLLCHIVPGGHC